MSGLVISDLGGGDYAVHLVDTMMWRQIKALPDKIVGYSDKSGRLYADVFNDWVGWLSLDDSHEEEPIQPPSGCPTREGRIITTWYCQSPVIENIHQSILIEGIVFLRG